MSLEDLFHDVVHVKLTNPEDIQIQKTEEQEPEHFVFSTFVVGIGIAGIKQHEQVLALDLNRKNASILACDEPVVVCHSHTQSLDPNNQAAGVPFPQGAYLPAGESLSITGTGPVWIAATSSTQGRVSLAINRRGPA